MSDDPLMPESHDCAGESAAYVLGALEPHEAAAFELHLERCAVCREEVESLAGVVRALPMSATQLRAPRRLRRRVRRAVRNGSPAVERAARDRGRYRRLFLGAFGSGSGRGSGSWRGWRARPAALAGTALALAAAAAVLVISLGSGGLGGTLLPARVTGVAGTAQLRVLDGRGELVVRHMTAPRGGHVYEVWLERGTSEPVPASVLFTVNSAGYADVGLPGSLRGVSAVLVTSEPLGGTERPTSAPVIDAELG